MPVSTYERRLRPNCCPREAGLDDRTTLLSAVEPLTARPAAVGRLTPFADLPRLAIGKGLLRTGVGQEPPFFAQNRGGERCRVVEINSLDFCFHGINNLFPQKQTE
jgi:hypothetical protein